MNCGKNLQVFFPPTNKSVIKIVSLNVHIKFTSNYDVNFSFLTNNSQICDFLFFSSSWQEMNNKPPASVNVTDEVTGAQLINHVGSEVIRGAEREEKDSTLCEAHGSNKASKEEVSVGAAPDEQSLLTKLRRMVSPPLSQSLALDNLVSIDGVHQRPFINHTEDGRDLSPDRNDSDRSAYEDASAETPEQEMFPGDGDLPLDSENKENGSAHGETQEPRNPEVCVLS